MGLRALALVLLLGATCAVASGSATGAANGSAASTHTAAASRGTAAARAAASPTTSGAAKNKASDAADAARAITGASGAGSSPSTSGPAATPSGPQPSSAVGTAISTAATIAGPSGPTTTDWLDEINRYRTAAGLAPVSDQPVWDAGIVAHLNYVAATVKSYLTGQYASLHTENPASPSYTRTGALEASRSDLFFDSSGLTPVDFVDGWLSAPFHAIGMLRGRLTQVAFAASPNGSAAGLDVIGGLDDNGPAETAPILFPGNGMTTNLTSYTGGESPDPLETCGWSSRGASYGLPLIALLPSAPKAGLSAQVVANNGSVLSTANGQLCVVDEVTYHSSDQVYGVTGKEILQDDHAVLLIARRPYAAGTYTATISQAGRADVEWSFTAAP